MFKLETDTQKKGKLSVSLMMQDLYCSRPLVGYLFMYNLVQKEIKVVDE